MTNKKNNIFILIIMLPVSVGCQAEESREISTMSKRTLAKNSQDIGSFNFPTKMVLLNSGYRMPISGLGTYSLKEEICVRSVSEHLKAGGCLIDTAFIYGNEKCVG